MDKLIYYLLLLFTVLSPLPFGSNIPLVYTFGATMIGVLTLLWAVTRVRSPQQVSLSFSLWLTLLFLLPCSWALIQSSSLVPTSWIHPLWQLSGELLGERFSGTVSLAPATTLTAVMRLLSYGLLFFLSFQFGRNRENSYRTLQWLAVAGVLYALYGLIIHWGNFGTVLLYEKKGGGVSVCSTFINRNSYATYAGMTLVCAMALFLKKMTRPQAGMGGPMAGRQQRIEDIVLGSWRPLIGLMLVVVALLSSHSRGGFLSTAAAVTLLLLIFFRNNRLRARGVFLAILGVVAITFTAYTISSAVLLKRLDSITLESEIRLAVYENTMDAIKDNPFLGFGYGAYKEGFSLYHRAESPGIYDKAHNTYLENIFELGLPAAVALFFSFLGLAITFLRGILHRRRDWIYPAVAFAVTLQVALHSLVDFSLQIPAVAYTYAVIAGVGAAQSFSSRRKSGEE